MGSRCRCVAGHVVPNQGAAFGRARKRTAQGEWSILGTREGCAPGQLHGRAGGIAVDAAGNLYVADTGDDRVQKYTATGNP